MWNEARHHCYPITKEIRVRHTNSIFKDWYGREKQVVDVEFERFVYKADLCLE